MFGGRFIRLLIFNHHSVYPPISGDDKIVYETARALSKNFQVKIITLSNRHKKHVSRDKRLEIIEIPSRLWNSLGLPLRAISYSIKSTSFIQWRLLYEILSRDFSFQEFVSPIIREYDPDLILCEHIYLRKAISRIKHVSHIPVVTRELNVEAEYMSLLCNTKMISNVAEKTIHEIEYNALKNSNAVITLSLRDALMIKQLYGIDADFTGLGWEITDYGSAGLELLKRIKLAEGEGYYVFVSSATKFALESLTDMVQIFSKLPTAKLVVSRQISKYVKSKKNILALNFLRPEELYQLYIHSHGVLAPLWKGSGIPIKMVEGLAYGKPVIVSKWVAETLPGLKHLENIYVVNSSSELEKAIKVLEADESLREHLCKGARSYYNSNLKWEHAVQRMRKVFERVLLKE